MNTEMLDNSGQDLSRAAANGMKTPRGLRARGVLLGLCACLFGGAGCVSFDAAEARRGQTEAFTNELARLEEEWLARPLSLGECVAIAMTNNYEVRKADLDAQLGRFSRDMAFSAFLPQVSASATRVDYDRDPVLNSQRFTSGGVDVGMAVLMPSTWFLYDEARHGRAAADLAAGYVRQGVALQTTAAFYEVLVQEKLVAAAERQLAAARETSGRVEGLAREGFARPWERDQARYLVEAREAQLGAARRALDVKRGDLLRAMGLSPLAGISLVPPEEEDFPPPEPLEELVLRALECNPRLPIADRQVVMKESAVRRAFCEFLPNLAVFGQWSFTGNKVMNPPSHNFDWGFKGTWDLFNGFRSVADVRAAKAERRQTELARENTFLSVMAGVVSARARRWRGGRGRWRPARRRTSWRARRRAWSRSPTRSTPRLRATRPRPRCSARATRNAWRGRTSISR